MATVNLGCKIDLQKIALKVDNVKYNPKKCPQPLKESQISINSAISLL